MSNQGLSVVLIRHAQSQWNLENRFSGWADPPLTEAGIAEAKRAGTRLLECGWSFDVVFCSKLQRAIATMECILSVLQAKSVEKHFDWRLNERHYGQLQGRLKEPDANHTTEEQIWRWRRGYLDKAKPLDLSDARHPRFSPLYKDVPEARLPSVENLAETRQRVTEFWQEAVYPAILSHRRILVSSHGNTLRALLMELAQMDVAEVEAFEIPTGEPILLSYDDQGRFLHWHYL